MMMMMMMMMMMILKCQVSEVSRLEFMQERSQRRRPELLHPPQLTSTTPLAPIASLTSVAESGEPQVLWLPVVNN